MARLGHRKKHAPAAMKHSQAPLSTTPFATVIFLPMAALVETAHPKQPSECSWNKVVQTQNPILSTLKRFCHPQVELAKNLIFPL